MAIKNTVSLSSKRILLITFLLTMGCISLPAQQKQEITGQLIDEKNSSPVSFATVTLVKASDLTVLNGAISNEKGVFIIGPVKTGNYILRVSNIGYKPVSKNIEIINDGVTDAGIIFLSDTSIMLKELVIAGERIKAKSDKDRTTFFVTKKMLDASNTGIDVLKLVPGVQIDLMHNISLEGSSNILIYVDGKERDKNFISQLDPDRIDRIEVISVLPSGYDGNLTGVLNIILKKDRESGINGKIVAELPTSRVVYIFPSFSLNYGFRKINLYTSYNGEMAYFDVHEKSSQKSWRPNSPLEITSNQYVRQKNWSNRLNYGFDYFMSDHDQVNLYAYYNPYSRELDGTADAEITGSANGAWRASKEDSDINRGNFYSMYYKHSFNEKGHEITIDVSNYSLKGETKTDFVHATSGSAFEALTNSSKPVQRITSLKADYTLMIGNKMNLSTGAKARMQNMGDRINGFEYNETIIALYGNISYKQKKYDMSLGLRAEKSLTGMNDNSRNDILSFFPYSSIRYKISARQNIQLSYNSSIKRPNLYQLNPILSMSDPYTFRKGNPFLTPELHKSLFLEHSIQFSGNYFATRFFYNNAANVINNLTFVNDRIAFETQVHNLGNMYQYGLQFSGSFRLGVFTINPYIKGSALFTSGNELAKCYMIKNRNTAAIETGLSAIVSFKHALSLTLTGNYRSRQSDIQGNSFSDLLYFISAEKTFKQNLKIGIVTAVPFMRTFTYSGAETKGSGFYTHYEGNLSMPVIPFWIRIGYQFNSGKSREKINRAKEEIDRLPAKGF